MVQFKAPPTECCEQKVARRPYGVLFIQKSVTKCPTESTKGGRDYLYVSSIRGSGAPQRVRFTGGGEGEGGRLGHERLSASSVAVQMKPMPRLFCLAFPDFRFIYFLKDTLIIHHLFS